MQYSRNLDFITSPGLSKSSTKLSSRRGKTKPEGDMDLNNLMTKVESNDGEYLTSPSILQDKIKRLPGNNEMIKESPGLKNRREK